MSKETVAIGDLVLEALEKAIQQDGECRLISKGSKSPGLLPGGRLTAARKHAFEQCLDKGLDFFAVREVEEGKGKTASTAHFVTIARAGIELLLLRKTPAQRAELLEKCANPHKEVALNAHLKATEGELKRLAVEREQLDQRASDLRNLLKRVADEQLSAIEQLRSRLDREIAEIKCLVSGPATPPPERPDAGADRVRPHAETEDDFDFQRSTCRELVFSWQDSVDPEVRGALERVMMNSGLQPVGEVGETVAFDGREHRTNSDLRPGDAAIVVEPGWQLVSPQGPLLIAPAQVAAPETAEEVENAPHA